MLRLNHLLAAMFIMLAIAISNSFCDQPQRGPLGVFNWSQTHTYPSVPWPSVPTENAKANCLVTDTAAVNEVAAIVTPSFDWKPLYIGVGGGLALGIAIGMVLTFRKVVANRAKATTGKK